MFFAGLALAQPLPIEQFAGNPDFTQMRLSPDGKYVAFLREVGGRRALFLLNLEQMQPARVDPGEYPMLGVSLGVSDVRWVSDNRVLYNTTAWDYYWAGACAINRDGTRARRLTGSALAPLDQYPLNARATLHAFNDKNPERADPG